MSACVGSTCTDYPDPSSSSSSVDVVYLVFLIPGGMFVFFVVAICCRHHQNRRTTKPTAVAPQRAQPTAKTAPKATVAPPPQRRTKKPKATAVNPSKSTPKADSTKKVQPAAQQQPVQPVVDPMLHDSIMMYPDSNPIPAPAYPAYHDPIYPVSAPAWDPQSTYPTAAADDYSPPPILPTTTLPHQYPDATDANENV